MHSFKLNSSSTIKVLMVGPGIDVNGGITSVEKLIINHVTPPIQIYHIPTFAQGSAIHNVKVFITAIKTLLAKIINRQVDIVHIHFAERGSTLRKVILASIALTCRQPLILHAHGATFKEFYAGLPTFVQQILANLFKRCTKFIAISQNWRDYYLKQFNLAEDQIITLYNPVSLPSSMPNRQSKHKLKLVFLGRIGQRGGALDLAKSVVKFPKQDKGSFDLIRALAALPEADLNRAELVLAGNGDLEAAQQLIKELNLEDKITIYSWLNSQERDELLASTDIFVLPSYHEGLPMSMLEAMAWGLPVIVTPVGGIPEVIKPNQNGLLVEPGNQEQLISAIQKLIQDDRLRFTLGNEGRKSVEQLDIKKYIDSLSLVYASVVKKDNSLVSQHIC